MRLTDALFNWLQIRVVADARPDDRSAQDTAAFFLEILEQDHQVTDLTYQADEERYTLSWSANGSSQSLRFAREKVDELLEAINNEPKYNCTFEE